MRRGKFRHHLRHEAQEKRFQADDAHMARDGSGKASDLEAGALEIGERFARMAQKQLSGRGEPHAAAQPLEERRPDFRLELDDLAIDGRGRDMERLGRAPDRAEPGYLVEIAQHRRVHGRPPLVFRVMLKKHRHERNYLLFSSERKALCLCDMLQW